MAKGAGGEKHALMELHCEFGSVSIGDRAARIGATVSRASLRLVDADKTFCNRRISGTLKTRNSDSAPGQGTFDGLPSTEVELTGIFDVKRLSVSVDSISLGLAFNREDCDINTLVLLAKRTGCLIVGSSEEITEAEKGDENDD